MGTYIGSGHCLTCPIRPESLFGCLKASELHLIEKFKTKIVTYKTGEIIYNEGENYGLVYTLRAGHIKLTKFNSDGKAQIVRIVKAGDLFGYEKLVCDSSYRHTAEALDDVELCQLSVAELKQLRNNHNGINQAITERALQQVMKSEELLTQVALLKSKARLAWFILDWVKESEEQVKFPISRRDLSQYLGLTIETISRHIAEWKRLGYIKETRKCIQVLDFDALDDIIYGEF